MPTTPPLVLSAEKRRAFLKTLAETANPSAAAHAAGVSRRRVGALRDSDAGFRTDWEEAIEIATDALEAEARHRALFGTEEPVFYRGEIVGTKIQRSDRLLELFLKTYRPDKFVIGIKTHKKDGQPPPITAAAAREELARRIALMSERGKASGDPRRPE